MASFHRASHVLVTASRLYLLFLPPYSSDLNPIELEGFEALS
ncbi:hypothetical protein SULI_10160 [Saccharolobus solfataricus]|uniref:Tc1-like transposase DDE domain-containing protein n=1 Tax=Saccharolobus solfataricus TaxID=2287 RepID=A0A3G2Y2X9_SACSO|nr:hypothetical protein SULB_03435 [Saccharolobus solfataricus]PVU76559.1 hypothetical protein DDW12_09875 [Sulfolobus islandicus]AYN75808.1 hypothetical protein SULC_03430 [Saccharolobus solfataricus]AYP18644.1 hypothetical protein SULA_03435 [Saccharolobus solfataricus]AZF69548.1 hypothetical protein SULG_10160 [Saccharolobus solfataricus]